MLPGNTRADVDRSPPGVFCREPYLPDVFFAFTNYGVSAGLQSVAAMQERVAKLNAFVESYRSGDEYDRDAITQWFPGSCCNRRPEARRRRRISAATAVAF